MYNSPFQFIKGRKSGGRVIILVQIEATNFLLHELKVEVRNKYANKGKEERT